MPPRDRLEHPDITSEFPLKRCVRLPHIGLPTLASICLPVSLISVFTRSVPQNPSMLLACPFSLPSTTLLLLSFSSLAHTSSTSLSLCTPSPSSSFFYSSLPLLHFPMCLPDYLRHLPYSSAGGPLSHDMVGRRHTWVARYYCLSNQYAR